MWVQWEQKLNCVFNFFFLFLKNLLLISEAKLPLGIGVLACKEKKKKRGEGAPSAVCLYFYVKVFSVQMLTSALKQKLAADMTGSHCALHTHSLSSALFLSFALYPAALSVGIYSEIPACCDILYTHTRMHARTHTPQLKCVSNNVIITSNNVIWFWLQNPSFFVSVVSENTSQKTGYCSTDTGQSLWKTCIIYFFLQMCVTITNSGCDTIDLSFAIFLRW